MLFELILTLIVLISGLLVLADKLWLASRRAADAKLPMVLDYAHSLFPILALVLVLRSFFFEPFRIPSGSMYPTLHIGDFILVNKMSYGIRLPVIYSKILDTGSPSRGEVVVFRYPVEPDKDYIKRVIGLPGDRISYMNKTLFVNDVAVTQQMVGRFEAEGAGAVMNGAIRLHEKLAEHPHDILIDQERHSNDVLDIVVPDGQYFVMGDNRDHSYDSRFWGFVPEENLKGKAFFIWMHFDGSIHTDRIGLTIE